VAAISQKVLDREIARGFESKGVYLKRLGYLVDRGLRRQKCLGLVTTVLKMIEEARDVKAIEHPLQAGIKGTDTAVRLRIENTGV